MTNITVTPSVDKLWKNEAMELFLQVRIDTPRGVVKSKTTKNIALVLDKSGSMAGEPLIAAIKNAQKIIENLEETDRVSIIAFDTNVTLVVPSTPVTNKEMLYKALQSIKAGSSTNLFEGWEVGYKEVIAGKGYGVNRVILLTDGQVNAGVVDPETMSTAVEKSRKDGVTTSMLGLGNSFNEVLIELLANVGGGNYYYVKNFTALTSAFLEEITEVGDVVGQQVQLSFTTAKGFVIGGNINMLVQRGNVVNLTDLLGGRSQEFILKASTTKELEESEVAVFTLEWTDVNNKRVQKVLPLRIASIEVVDLDEIPVNKEVVSKARVYESSQLFRESTIQSKAGNMAAAAVFLNQAQGIAESVDLSCVSMDHAKQLGELKSFKLTQDEGLNKSAMYTTYRTSRNKSS